MQKLFIPLAVAVAVLGGLLIYSQLRHEPFHVSGFIEADEIRIGSRVGGRVKLVLAQEGQAVKQGMKLVELEPFDLLERKAEAEAQLLAKRADLARLKEGFRTEEIAQAKARHAQWTARLEKLQTGPRRQEKEAAQAQLELASASLERSQAAYERTKKLFEQKAASQEEMDRATEDVKVSQSSVMVREAELNLLKEGTRSEEIAEAQAQKEEAHQAWQLMLNGYRPQDVSAAEAAVQAAEASVRLIEEQLQELSISAPVDGIVEAVDLQPGDLVGANAPVMSLLDTRELWVRAYVPENRLNVKLDQQVNVTVDSFPDQRFSGQITFISRNAEFTPGNVQTPEERSKQVFRIKVKLQNDQELLRAGMAADVWFELKQTEPSATHP